ncbi:hypothetical protein DM860_007804 [Cuscuta australis]|uniref:Myb/SANT-like domain-containing protein n=1 Tax=Cuscuta australis TaxID=267555 RepID=A0A328DY32_9ASTE|nr:hypothetical protein DM860_007804 [Cuscuta australis]
MAFTQGKKRRYLTWNGQMDGILISVLYDQIKEGNKGDGDRKPQAYQAVADKQRSQLGVSVTVEHVKNRIKCWKKHYSIITDIRTYTKFKWDEEKKMVTINIDDLKDWNEYCKSHPPASSYRNKTIDNWDDICILFGSDRAIGDGAEQYDEAAMAMDEEMTSEGMSTSTGSVSKKVKKDRLEEAVTSFTNSFNEYVQSKINMTSKASGKEIHDVVSKVDGILRHQVLKAVKKFMNMPDEFQMLKDLPEDEKLDWILLCLE